MVDSSSDSESEGDAAEPRLISGILNNVVRIAGFKQLRTTNAQISLQIPTV